MTRSQVAFLAILTLAAVLIAAQIIAWSLTHTPQH
jgi:hypothetical protein